MKSIWVMPRTAPKRSRRVADRRVCRASVLAARIKASAPTSEEMATLAPKDEEVNGASSDEYQSMETIGDDQR